MAVTFTSANPIGGHESMRVAREAAVGLWEMAEGLPGLIWWRGSPWEWFGNRWVQRDREWLENRLWVGLEHLHVSVATGDGSVIARRWNPDRTKVADVARAMQALTTMPYEHSPAELPVGGLRKGCEVGQCVAFDDVVLEVGTGRQWERGRWWLDGCVLPVMWNEKAECPTWERCLQEWSGGDAEWIDVLQRMMGYCLLPDRGLQRWFLLYGKVRGGKGTIMGVLHRLMRGGFESVSLMQLAERFGMWGLENSRVISVGEVSEVGRGREAAAATALVKNIVGGDPITIDRKGQSLMRRVKVNAVVVMQSNQVPDLGDRGHGLTSKMVMLPFQHSFLGREDFGLMAKLEAEMEGIARWCVEGARKVVEEVDPKRKVWTPSAAQADAEEIGVEGNPVRDFVRSCLKQGGKTTPEEIWRVWQVWAPKAGVSVGSTNRRGLSQRVKEEARWPIVSQRTAVQRYLDGVSVKAEWQLGGADAGE